MNTEQISPYLFSIQRESVRHKYINRHQPTPEKLEEICEATYSILSQDEVAPNKTRHPLEQKWPMDYHTILNSLSRLVHFVQFRQFVTYIAVTHYKFGFTQLGRTLSDERTYDHSTIIYYIGAMTRQLETDPVIRDKYSKILKILKI